MLKRNTATTIPFALIDATDGSALTGATVTARRVLDNGDQEAADGSVSEKGNGQYVFAADSGDMDAAVVGLLFTAADAIPVHVAIATTARLVSELNDFDPTGDTVANVTTVATITNAVTTDSASREASKADVSAIPAAIVGTAPSSAFEYINYNSVIPNAGNTVGRQILLPDSSVRRIIDVDTDNERIYLDPMGFSGSGTFYILPSIGPAVPGGEMDLVDEPNATAVTAIQDGLSTFDHTTNTVTVGTNNDKTGYSLTQSFPENFSALGINASGHVQRVVLVDTTTVNTDMRGTDNALLSSNYTAPDNTGIGAIEAIVGDLTEDDDGLRFTAKALEETPASDCPTAEEVAAEVGSTLAAAHGAGSWQTATGFAEPGDAMTLTAGERTAIANALLNLADGIETGATPRQALQRIAAVVAGLLPEGAGSGTETFKGLDQQTDRVAFTVDAEGNRTAVTYDPS